MPDSRVTNRMLQARGYHPRARTVGQEPASRPAPRRGPERGTGDRTRASDMSARRAAAVRATHGRTGAFRTVSAATRPDTLRRRPGAPSLRRVSVVRPAPPLAEPRKRLRQINAIVVACLVVIAIRLVVFQLDEAPSLAAKGLDSRMVTVVLPATRGAILDRDGEVLAGSAEGRLIFSDSTLVSDPAGEAATLGPVLGIDPSVLVEKLKPHLNELGTQSRYEVLAQGVSIDLGNQISALHLDGIGVHRYEMRNVPGGALAANLIGFTGSDQQGLAGLEESYDHELAGVPGQLVYEGGEQIVNLDAQIPGGVRQETPAQAGRSLQLTIVRDLQYEVQRILDAQMRQTGAWNGSAVVLDVRTGEVLAQASWPTFDASDPFRSDPATRGDMASGMLVDPGSVHKAIVFAAALQEGVISAGETIPVPTTITKGATTFHDSHEHPDGARFTLPGILAWSSNVGTIEIADRLGAQKLYEYQRAFGLGDLVGEGLPGEAAGLVQPPQNWSADSYGTIPIGLGVATTPLQMAAVYAAIANGGVYVRPTLVKAIIDADGTAHPTAPPATWRVVSVETATTLRNMLEAVVNAPRATGLAAALTDYRVAGKTGTGLVVANGHYVGGELASFIGMAPAEAPRYVVAVFAHTPGGAGGTVAAPAFEQIMEQTLLHFRVPPSTTRPPAFTIYE